MKNSDKPAYPSGEAYKSQSIPGGDWVECRKGALHNGLTKREMFAMAAMQSLLSDHNIPTIAAVNLAVECADLLLRKLDGENINPPIIPNPDWPEGVDAPCQ